MLKYEALSSPKLFAYAQNHPRHPAPGAFQFNSKTILAKSQLLQFLKGLDVVLNHRINVILAFEILAHIRRKVGFWATIRFSRTAICRELTFLLISRNRDGAPLRFVQSFYARVPKATKSSIANQTDIVKDFV